MFELSDLSQASETLSKPELYQQLVVQVRSLLDGEPDRIAKAANFSSLVFHSVPDLNWVGFYFFDGKELVVGPFQGKPACVRIALGKGVCGTAAAQCTAQLVPDVHAFPGHIACDSASNSEIVIPLLHQGELIGVLDIDSPTLNRLDAEDLAGMQALADEFMAVY